MNRAERRTQARRAKKLAALGSGAALASGVATAAVTLSATPAGAATIVVTNTSDNAPGSLRAALAAANNGDVIDATGISGTISLATQLEIDAAVTINGPGARNLTITGNNPVRVFSVDNGGPTSGTVTINDLTIANGKPVNSPGGAGGGIKFYSGDPTNLVVNNVVITGRSTQAGAGFG